MKLKISNEFSTSPGPRLISEGDFSGEEFRTRVLLPCLKKAIAHGDVLIVDLDGVSGFGTSFLEESFGGLIRIDGFSLQELNKTLKLHSSEVPDWIDEINEYMEEASTEGEKSK